MAAALPFRTDADVRAERHEFIRDEARDAIEGAGPSAAAWEVRTTAKYDAQLYKELAIADLSRWSAKQVGLRWRTESDVIAGKGQSSCAEVKCGERTALTSFEVVFKYAERGERRQALVKVRLCPPCAEKMRAAKADKKTALRHGKEKKKRERNRDDDTMTTTTTKKKKKKWKRRRRSVGGEDQ